MGQRFLVRPVLLFGELPRALIELRGHACRLVRGTTQGFQHGREFLLGQSFYFTESAGTILMLSTPMRLSGRSWGCVGVVAIFSSTSPPLISLPNAVY